MKFNSHSELHGKHAFLSASKYHWIRYSDERFTEVYRNSLVAAEGTRLHALAAELIRARFRLTRNDHTINAYVNDCIGYRMTPEQVLVYSEFAFGTADAIRFVNGVLSIFDLKTGVGKVSFDQLLVYCALFCLEYEFKPFEIQYDLRVYQNNEILEFDPDPDVIAHIMDRIVTFDQRIRELREEAEL